MTSFPYTRPSLLSDVTGQKPPSTHGLWLHCGCRTALIVPVSDCKQHRPANLQPASSAEGHAPRAECGHHETFDTVKAILKNQLRIKHKGPRCLWQGSFVSHHVTLLLPWLWIHCTVHATCRTVPEKLPAASWLRSKATERYNLPCFYYTQSLLLLQNHDGLTIA